MFFNKNKNKEEKQSNIINDADYHDYIVLSNRPLSFYKEKQKLFLRTSTILMIVSFLFIFGGKLIIESKNSKQETFLTNIYGQTTSYTQNEERQKILDEFFEYRENKNKE